MTAGNLLLLGLSVLLSAGRNAISKKTATVSRGRREFFLSQTLLFLSAALLVGVGCVRTLRTSGLTVLFGVIYGVLLILAQWMLTAALRSGNTSLCSVVYSLGFLLPTLSGTLFWQESFTARDGVGLALAVGVILLSAKSEKGSASPMPHILVAMLASGGLGIMQKVQQTSPTPEEKGAFLFIAFLVATLASLTAFLVCKKEPSEQQKKDRLSPILTGLCFGGANLCNTVLAGAMKSAVVFPTQNIGTVLLSTLFGMALFGERLTKKTAAVLLLCITTVLVFTVG